MRESQGPFGDDPLETESRRLTPSIGLSGDSDSPTDSSNEDFLFHLYRGSELLQDNRVHEAKEELERALHLQPLDTKGQDLLAVVYFRLGLYPRAIQIYEQLRRRNANDTAILLNLALCYLKTGQPQLARRDLEQLLTLNSTHSRAWGYLGLACERLGDLSHAEDAFQRGGHGQMARRIAARRESGGTRASAAPPEVSQELRDVAGTAYQELDAGELSFSLAAPTHDPAVQEKAGQSWRPVELGQVKPDDGTLNRSPTRHPAANDKGPAGALPHLGNQQALNRRPTLIAPIGAPPMHELRATEFTAVERIPSHLPPSFGLDDAGVPAVSQTTARRPVVAVPNPFAPAKAHALNEGAGATLQPPPVETPNAPIVVEPPISEPESDGTRPHTPLGIGPPPQQPIEAPARKTGAPIRFPSKGAVLHPSGVALVRTTADSGFAARLESIRTQQSTVALSLLKRHTKGKPGDESFGGIASPMVLATGEGELILAARPGRKLVAFPVDGEMCFAREDVLLGFSASLAYENGRLSTGEGEHTLVVQLRGDGTVLFELVGDLLVLSVTSGRSLSVRREAILGWFGRLVPRAIAPSDAPCGQRGLVSFAGEGRVLVSGA